MNSFPRPNTASIIRLNGGSAWRFYFLPRVVVTIVMATFVLSACAGPGVPAMSAGAAQRSAGQATPQPGKVPMPAMCGPDGQRCREEFVLPNGWQLPVYRNVPLSGNSTITHAVIVVHGALRDPMASFAGMMAAASRDHADAHTLVLAPWFQTAQDDPGSREPYWVNRPAEPASASGWLQGDAAVQPAGLSSFTVTDDLITTLADPRHFPNLQSITIAGHSAGGQFVQRYAAFGIASSSRSVRFVTANPSSYVYFTPTRPVDNGTRFVVPPVADCPDYDTYKYGMTGRIGYTARLSAEQALTQYLHRRVTIVNGGADTFNNGDEDISCAATKQGPNRLTRGSYYFNYLHSHYPSAPHDRIVVPGVGHNHYALFESPAVEQVLFGS